MTEEKREGKSRASCVCLFPFVSSLILFFSQVRKQTKKEVAEYAEEAPTAPPVKPIKRKPSDIEKEEPAKSRKLQQAEIAPATTKPKQVKTRAPEVSSS